jgi:hypothetical protein
VTNPLRHTFLDLFRGLFVILMVEGHLVRALLEEASRSSQVFRLHEVLHGMTAPGFLFTSGFALAIASHRKRNDLQSVTPAFARRLWRGLSLILVGYALHLPYWSLTKTLTAATADQWGAFIAFGVLQLIGTVILVVRLLFLVIRDDRWFLLTLSIVFLLVVYLTPVTWNWMATTTLPDILAAALSGATGSPFPIFPFAGFFLAGTIVSWLFLDTASRGEERRFMTMLGIAGLLCAGGGIGASILSFWPLGQTEFWYTSPSYFWIRLGILFMLMGSFWFVENFLKKAPSIHRFRPQWVATLGRESYLVYVVHLLIIFGWLLNPFVNLRAWFGGQLGWVPALAIAGTLTAVLVTIASTWQMLKKEHPPVIQGLLSWFWLTFFYYVVINPY